MWRIIDDTSARGSLTKIHGKTVPMDKRLLAITAAELPGVSVVSLRVELGISRKTF